MNYEGKISELKIEDTKGWRAAILNRCSTEKEVQERAIEVQQEESEDVCAQNDWEVVRVYKELVSGRYADKRTEYQQLLVDIELNQFDIIVVKSQDRIMRNQKDWCEFVELINEYNILLYFYMDRKFYDPETDDFYYGMTMQMHAMYSKNLAQKITLSHKTRQLNKSHVNISEIYGWDKIGKYTFAINEEEATYIREAYELLRKGHGFRSISNIMYDRGARSRRAGRTYKNHETRRVEYYSDKISSTVWRKILYNPIMYGTAVMNKQTKPISKKKRINNPESEWIYFENALPAIVSKEYFEETIRMHQEGSGVKDCKIKDYDRTMSKRGVHMWSGKFICACCGSKYYRAKYKEEIKWKCGKSMVTGSAKNGNEGGCDNIVLEEVYFKKVITEEITKRYNDIVSNIDSIMEEALNNIRQVFNADDVSNEIHGLESQLDKLRNQKKVLFEKLVNQVINDDDFKSYNAILEGEMASIENKITELRQSMSDYISYDKRLAEIKSALTKDVMEKIKIDAMIKCIDMIEVNKDGLCKVTFHKANLYKLLKVYDKGMVDSNISNIVDFEFIYKKKTVYEVRREETNQQVLEALKENPKQTMQEVADLLGKKYSYIYTSFANLRKQGLIEYKQFNFEHDGIWLVHDSEMSYNS